MRIPIVSNVKYKYKLLDWIWMARLK